MSKYVRGVKRNQIIQRWIQGIDDPDYEVFPTKKEGKYIVKLREKSEPKTNPDGNGSKTSPDENEPPTENEPENGSLGIPCHQISPENEPSVAAKPRSRSTSTAVPRSTVDSTIRNSEVQGINLEILEQLRNLGEELRNDRFKKEQKQYIKHVVNKELSKSRIRSRYVPDIFPEPEPEQPNPTPLVVEEQPEPEPIIEQPLFRSRIRR